MVRFLGQFNSSLAVVIFISCCFRESISLNIKGNHHINPYRIGRSVNRNPRIAPLYYDGELRLQALSLGLENDTKETQQLATTHASFSLTRNTSEPEWNSVLTPSIPAISTVNSQIPTANSQISAVDKLRIATFICCSINVFLALVLKSAPGSWRFFLAGGLCAAISHTIPTPVDVVKVSGSTYMKEKFDEIFSVNSQNNRLDGILIVTPDVDPQTSRSELG